MTKKLTIFGSRYQLSASYGGIADLPAIATEMLGEANIVENIMAEADNDVDVVATSKPAINTAVVTDQAGIKNTAVSGATAAVASNGARSAHSPQVDEFDAAVMNGANVAAPAVTEPAIAADGVGVPVLTATLPAEQQVPVVLNTPTSEQTGLALPADYAAAIPAVDPAAGNTLATAPAPAAAIVAAPIVAAPEQPIQANSVVSAEDQAALAAVNAAAAAPAPNQDALNWQSRFNNGITQASAIQGVQPEDVQGALATALAAAGITTVAHAVTGTQINAIEASLTASLGGLGYPYV